MKKTDINLRSRTPQIHENSNCHSRFITRYSLKFQVFLVFLGRCHPIIPELNNSPDCIWDTSHIVFVLSFSFPSVVTLEQPSFVPPSADGSFAVRSEIDNILKLSSDISTAQPELFSFGFYLIFITFRVETLDHIFIYDSMLPPTYLYYCPTIF